MQWHFVACYVVLARISYSRVRPYRHWAVPTRIGGCSARPFLPRSLYVSALSIRMLACLVSTPPFIFWIRRSFGKEWDGQGVSLVRI